MVKETGSGIKKKRKTANADNDADMDIYKVTNRFGVFLPYMICFIFLKFCRRSWTSKKKSPPTGTAP